MRDDSLLNRKYDRSEFTLENKTVWDRLVRIKGEPFVAYRELIRKAETGEVLTDVPVEVFIKTTFNCNHRCPRCPHGVGITPSGRAYNMRLDTLKKVLDEGSAKGLQSVVFTGGEPTLHPEFIEFLACAASKKLQDISVITNGSLLSDRMINGLIENGVTRLNVSFDSITPNTYKDVRGVDDYAKVIDNIDRLIEIRRIRGVELPLLSLSFVLSEENANELDGFIEMWKEKADGGIKIYPYKNLYSIVDDAFYSSFGNGKKKPSDLEESALPVNLSRSTPIMSEYKIQCTIPWYRCHIGINGDIQGCTTLGFCDHPEMVMGNIHEMSLECAWKSERWKALRELTLSGQYEKHAVCTLCQGSV